MRAFLRLAALALLLGTVAWWFLAGRNSGWTKNQVGVWHVEELTGIQYVTYEKRFVPGVDLLVLSGGMALVLGAGSFLVRRN